MAIMNGVFKLNIAYGNGNRSFFFCQFDTYVHAKTCLCLFQTCLASEFQLTFDKEEGEDLDDN